MEVTLTSSARAKKDPQWPIEPQSRPLYLSVIRSSKILLSAQLREVCPGVPMIIPTFWTVRVCSPWRLDYDNLRVNGVCR